MAAAEIRVVRHPLPTCRLHLERLERAVLPHARPPDDHVAEPRPDARREGTDAVDELPERLVVAALVLQDEVDEVADVFGPLVPQLEIGVEQVELAGDVLVEVRQQLFVPRRTGEFGPRVVGGPGGRCHGSCSFRAGRCEA